MSDAHENSDRRIVAEFPEGEVAIAKFSRMGEDEHTPGSRGEIPAARSQTMLTDG